MPVVLSSLKFTPSNCKPPLHPPPRKRPKQVAPEPKQFEDEVDSPFAKTLSELLFSSGLFSSASLEVFSQRNYLVEAFVARKHAEASRALPRLVSLIARSGDRSYVYRADEYANVLAWANECICRLKMNEK
jgi:hypothetical protein